MQNRFETPEEARRKSNTNRRDFMKLSAMAAAAAAMGPSRIAQALAASDPRPAIPGRGNAMPGRIVLFQDPLMDGHESTINRDQVEPDVHHAVRLLTGNTDTAAAFESLFSGLHAGSRIAIKVNCLAWNDTRWEVVRGIVSGLSMMLGGTYDVSQVTIFDVQTTLSNHGYVAAEFTFNGNTPLITSTNDCSPSYYVYGSHRLSNYILNSDYVINVPVLKAHNVGYPQNLITTSYKNHYGSICPQNLCDNIPGMLTLNADPNIKDKTALVVTSALRGTYQGNPWEPAQLWNTFDEQTPNMLFVTTDPCTESYWALDYINAERVTHGWSTLDCPWIEQSSGDPYNLGVSDPGEMDVIHFDPSGVASDSVTAAAGTFLAPNVPNPFSDSTTLRFRLGRPGRAAVLVAGASGRVLRHLGDRAFPAGYSELKWDGRNDSGRRLPAGIYFVKLQTDEAVKTRRVLLAQ